MDTDTAPAPEAAPEAASQAAAPYTTVQRAIEQARAFAAQMAAEFPDLADDERAFLDTLEGETDALEVCDRVLRRSLARQRLATAAKQEKGDIEARIARFERQAKGAKEVALAILQAAGVPDRKGVVRLERASYTATISQAAASVEVTDAAKLPPACLRQPPPEADKAACKARLEALQAAIDEAETEAAEAEATGHAEALAVAGMKAAEARDALENFGARLLPPRPTLTVRTR